MKYVVKYTNPYGVTRNNYTFETRSKAELNKFLENARKYSGSYTNVSVEKVSEAKKKK